MADDKKQPDSASELDQNNVDAIVDDTQNDVPDQKDADIYDDEGRIRSDFRKSVADTLDANDVDTLNQYVEGLHESELGDLIESLKPERRQKLVELLGDSFDFAALTEVDEAIRVEIVDAIPVQLSHRFDVRLLAGRSGTKVSQAARPPNPCRTTCPPNYIRTFTTVFFGHQWAVRHRVTK